MLIPTFSVHRCSRTAPTPCTPSEGAGAGHPMAVVDTVASANDRASRRPATPAMPATGAPIDRHQSGGTPSGGRRFWPRPLFRDAADQALVRGALGRAASTAYVEQRKKEMELSKAVSKASGIAAEEVVGEVLRQATRRARRLIRRARALLSLSSGGRRPGAVAG